MASKAKVVEPFLNLDDLYSKIKNLPQWPKVTKLRACTDYVHEAKGADLATGELQKSNSDEVPKTIVCHDMKGGYLEDKYAQKTSHILENSTIVLFHFVVIVKRVAIVHFANSQS